jgi:hypothetical protein
MLRGVAYSLRPTADRRAAGSILLTALAAILVGAVVGFLALLLFWYFLIGLLQGRFRQVTFTSFLGLVLGSTIASAPIGHAALSGQLWAWYVVGEAIPLLVGSGIGAAWFILTLMRREGGRRD